MNVEYRLFFKSAIEVARAEGLLTDLGMTHELIQTQELAFTSMTDYKIARQYLTRQGLEFDAYEVGDSNE